MSIQYLLDEHIPPLYRTQLVRRQPNLTIRIIGDPDAPPKGTLDPEILIWCENHNFILVTNNRKSMPKHLADHIDQGRHIPGIFVMDLGHNIGEMIEELLLISSASNDDEYHDRIEYLPLT
ncbi:hypothetical protein [Prochlorothrix hollandica]|uniref:hypothetical protein n=1 Tax=Prochlorothrix hollandica TaxID=1223 RepID=UPI00333EC124